MSSESDDDVNSKSLVGTEASIINTSDSDNDDDVKEEIDSRSCFELQQLLSSSPTCVASAMSIVPQHSDPRPESTDSAPWPPLPMSSKALRTHNPIRAIVDPVLSSMGQGICAKPRISLALGDPVAAANSSTGSSSTCLQPCPLAIRSIINVLSTDPMKTASYTNAIGTLEGRQAIAQYHSHPYYTFDPQEDIVIASGCSGALELILSALLDPSDAETPVLLIPEPGFPLYRVIAEACGAMVVAYPLDPDEKWQVDVPLLRSIIQTIQKQNRNGIKPMVIRGMVVNNPSNPTGAVYSASHLRRIIQLCSECRIPIIADEIYGDLVFDPHMFIPLAEIAAEMGRTVPVITAGGIGKQYLLPGWRIGWLCIQDNVFGSLQNVRDGVKRLAQIILGASHLAQIAIPSLLLKSSEVSTCQSGDVVELMKWKCDVRSTLQEQAVALCGALEKSSPYLDVIEPQGAMYAMVRIRLPYFNDEIRNDVAFMKLLLDEENVFVLPGTCFGFPDSFRIVFCAPVPALTEAADRIHQFCRRHCRM